ncbi:hypothetical protein I4U23_015571 [Adineta vaga]|nr:hypothetical protein I4U23_015571 [Adineta vaga]
MLRSKSQVNKIATQYATAAWMRNNFDHSNRESSISCLDRNLFGIWYCEGHFDEIMRSEMKKRLNILFDYTRIFTDLLDFIQYITQPLTAKEIFFILTGQNAQYLFSTATKRLQYPRVYRFQPAPSSNNDPDIFTDINELFRKLSEDINAYIASNEYFSTSDSSSTDCRESIVPPPWTVCNSKALEKSFQSWNKETPEFFLFQALTKILTRMKCDPVRSLEEMFAECRIHYMGDPKVVGKIDAIQNNYHSDHVIRYYTEDSFFFRSIGRAFRSEDFERIFIFRRSIIDLHSELDKLIRQQGSVHKTLRLYRGKKISTTVLQQLQDSIGALLSMNGFLSTTHNQEMAIKFFAGADQNRSGYESVLFQFEIDQANITRTYADISTMSNMPEEEEVLFSIGSIWRIVTIEKAVDSSFWTIDLIACSDADLRIIQFFEELPDNSTLLMLGDVLRELGQHTKAEKFYNQMLSEQTISDEIRFILYYNIAIINMEQEKSDVALENFHKAEKLLSSKPVNPTLWNPRPLYCPSATPSSIHVLNNMGLLYQKKGELDNALIYYTQALEDKQSDRIDQATVNDNIGLIYYRKGEYKNALEFLSNAVKLAQDHASLAQFKNHYDDVHNILFVQKTS